MSLAGIFTKFYCMAFSYLIEKEIIYTFQALKDLPRDKIQLATKFGCFISEDGNIGVKGTPEYVRECCEGSLNRLDVDYIDLYYQHRVDTSVPIEDTVRVIVLRTFLICRLDICYLFFFHCTVII